MPGPWEQYAAPASGPWAQYQAPVERRQAGASGSWAEPPSFMRRVVKGLSDPLDASAQALTRVLPESVMGGSAGDIDGEIQAREREYQASRGATPGIDGGRALGNFAVALPLAAAGPAAAASLPVRMLAGGAASGASGALQPVVQGEFAPEKTKQILTAGLVGAAAAPVAGAVARVVRPNTRPEVQTLINEGVTPTPGQIMGGAWQRTEEKARSLPIVGDAITAAHRAGVNDLNRAAYARALAPIGGTVPREAGRDGVAEVERQLSTAYDRLLPRLSFRADQQFNAELSNLNQLATQLPPAQAQRFQQIVRDQVVGKLTPQGNASGVTIKEVESDLGRLARGYASDPAIDNRLLGDALEEARAAIRRTLERTNPAHADELRRINEGWAVYSKIRNASARVGADKGFSPAQLDAAVRASDASVAKGRFGRNQASMQDLSAAGRDVLAQAVPNSGTADRVMLGAAASGGAWMLEPTVLTAAGAASLPYLPMVRNAFATLLTQRPQAAGSIADRIRELLPRSAVGAPAVYQGSRE